ncbi:MAG: hypothetical protein OEW04_10285 [Nitrospirota bacterium]|nr:hypothetical protein [Nitrospirota bacterium]
MAELVNEIRYFHYISGVLEHQQADPVCSKCKAFANTLARMKEGIAELESVHVERIHTLPGGLMGLLEAARNRLEGIKPPGDAVGQKKAGNCKMPEGVCFIKLSKAVRDRL